MAFRLLLHARIIGRSVTPDSVGSSTSNIKNIFSNIAFNNILKPSINIERTSSLYIYIYFFLSSIYFYTLDNKLNKIKIYIRHLRV
jgi:hypothetical protein